MAAATIQAKAPRTNEALEDASIAVVEDGSRSPLVIRKGQSCCARLQGVERSMETSWEWAARKQRVKRANAALPTNSGGPRDTTQEGMEERQGMATGQSHT